MSSSLQCQEHVLQSCLTCSILRIRSSSPNSPGRDAPLSSATILWHCSSVGFRMREKADVSSFHAGLQPGKTRQIVSQRTGYASCSRSDVRTQSYYRPLLTILSTNGYPQITATFNLTNHAVHCQAKLTVTTWAWALGEVSYSIYGRSSVLIFVIVGDKAAS